MHKRLTKLQNLEEISSVGNLISISNEIKISFWFFKSKKNWRFAFNSFFCTEVMFDFLAEKFQGESF